MVFFIHSQLHISPSEIGLTYTLKMFRAYQRKLEMWSNALGDMGVDKEKIRKIVNTTEIPEHWRKD